MHLSKTRIKQLIKEEVEHLHTDDDDALRLKGQLGKIAKIATYLQEKFEEDADQPQPLHVTENVEVVLSLLKSVLDFKNGEDLRHKK